MHPGREDGFGLTETMVSVGLFTLVLGMVFSLFVIGQRSWESGLAQMLLTTELQRALQAVSRELAESRNDVNWITSPPADGRWYSSLVFRIPEDGDGDGTPFLQGTTVLEPSAQWITYQQSGAQNRLIRSQGNNPSTVLAHHVTQVSFRRQASRPDIVEIQLTATATEHLRTVTRVSGTQVKLRN